MAEPLGAVGAVEGPDVCVCGGGSILVAEGEDGHGLDKMLSSKEVNENRS